MLSFPPAIAASQAGLRQSWRRYQRAILQQSALMPSVQACQLRFCAVMHRDFPDQAHGREVKRWRVALLGHANSAAAAMTSIKQQEAKQE
jgi:hypothetical protein